MLAHILISLLVGVLAYWIAALFEAGHRVALIIGIIYFIMVRPQQKQRQKHESALKALKRGDEVVTAGGIIGEVIHIREASKDAGAKGGGLDDRVTIKSGESRLIIERGKIARINGAASAAESNSKSVSSAE